MLLSCVDRKDTTVKVLRRNVFAVLQPCVRKEWSPLNFFLFRISKPILFHEFHGKPFSFGCKHNRFFTAFTADKILFLQPLQNREIISLPASTQQRIISLVRFPAKSRCAAFLPQLQFTTNYGIVILVLPINGKRLAPCIVRGASCPLIL